MQGDWLLIRVAALMAAIVLPVISALSVSKSVGRNNLVRYLRCVSAYGAAVVLVECGYVFQGLVTDVARARNFYGGWHLIQMIFTQYQYFDGFDDIVLIASIIACAVLFARNYRSRAITAFRASFVTFMSFDILFGMVAGYAAEQYIMCGAFNFIGAFVFGAVCTCCFNRLVPLKAA